MVLHVRYVDVLTMKYFFLSALVLFIIVQEDVAQYVPPTPSVEPLFPKGLRMSIAHEDGISLVAFHVKFNEDFEGLEAGTIARDIVKVRNGRWTYEDRTTRLKRGDIIYYWMHVVYDRLGYNLIDKQYVVNDFYNYDGTPVMSTVKGGDQPCTTYSITEIFEKNGKRQNTCSGQLIFEDNFDNLNTTRWTILERFSDTPDYEFVVYMNSDDNIEAKDGSLHIKPVLVDDKYGIGFVRSGSLVLNNCTNTVDTQECRRDAFGSYVLPPIISGRLNTKGTFTFRYGRVQVRAKLPRGDWIYPVITLESTNANTNHTTTHNVIRIAGAIGNAVLRSPEGTDLSGSVLSAGGLTVVQTQSKVPQSNRMSLPTKASSTLWSDDYHVYELEWRSGRILAKVDGMPFGEQVVAASFDTPVYLNLGLAVGGHGEFEDRSRSGNYEKPWRNIESKALFKFYLARHNWLQTWRESDTGLHIDYVKVWAL